MEEFWYKTKIFLMELAQFKKRSNIQRYGFPIAVCFLIFYLKYYLFVFFGDAGAFLLLTFVVALSSWYGGFGPGLFATFLSATINFGTYLRSDSSVHPLFGDFLLTGIFLVEGFVISLMSEARYETEEQKDEFLGFAAHELKNPLSSIKGYIGLILKQVKKDDEKIASYAKSVDHQIDRIVELINDFLDVTKIEIGKFNYKDDYFIIDSLVKDIVEHQRLITQDHLLELKGFSKKVVLGDKFRIGQVLINLITNATKYSPVHSKILIHITKKNHFVIISVRDKGIGIPTKEQKKIFTQFFRTRSAEKGNIQGLGLGLYIVDQIIKHYHGNLWVKSTVGKGSTFFVQLPTQ